MGMRHAFARSPNEGGLPWQTTTRTSITPVPRAIRDPARVEAAAVAVREVPADRAAALVAPAAAPVAGPAEAAAAPVAEPAEVAAASVDPAAAAAAEGLEEALIRGAAPVVVAMVEAAMQEAAVPVVEWVVAAVGPRAVARAVRVAWGIRAVDLPVATSVGQAGPAAPVDAGLEVQAGRTSRSSLQEQKGAEK
jgi:hypothetical protein